MVDIKELTYLTICIESESSMPIPSQIKRYVPQNVCVTRSSVVGGLR